MTLSVDRQLADTGTDDGQQVRPGHGQLAPVDRRIFVVSGILFVVLIALSGRYGFHRDELYFLDCARHLAAGYVDQPVLTPLLARVSLWAFGVSLPGLRLWPALAGAGTVVLAGLLAREFGGKRTAQLLGALGAATMPALLGADHLFGPTGFDMFFWTALSFFIVRIGRTGDSRLWIPAGIVLGFGLANKHNIGLFAAALAVGIVAGGGGRQLANRWFVAGALIAAAFTAPDLWWQATHHWPTIEMTHRLNQENGGIGNVGTWIIGQLFVGNLALVWVWVVGIRYLWRSDRPLWRALVWAYGLLFVLFALTTGSKVYYLAAAYIYLVAAGAVGVENWLDAAPVRRRRLLALLALTTARLTPAWSCRSCRPATSVGPTAPIRNSVRRSDGPSSSRRSARCGTRSRPISATVPSSSPPTTAKPAPSTSSAGGAASPPRSAVTTTSGSGAPAIPRQPPSWPWPRVRWMSPATPTS